MIALTQYIVYLLVGGFYSVGITVLLSFAFNATDEAMGRAVALLLSALFLAGFASGLGFFFPRVAAIVGIILVLPFLYVSFYGGADAFFFKIIIIPASLVVIISILALMLSKTSFWETKEQTNSKIPILIFAAIPVFIAIPYIVLTLLIFVFPFVL